MLSINKNDSHNTEEAPPQVWKVSLHYLPFPVLFPVTQQECVYVYVTAKDANQLWQLTGACLRPLASSKYMPDIVPPGPSMTFSHSLQLYRVSKPAAVQ